MFSPRAADRKIQSHRTGLSRFSHDKGVDHLALSACCLRKWPGVRKRTLPQHIKARHSGSVRRSYSDRRSKRPLPQPPAQAPLHAVCPIYPARPAISTQWSHADGSWAQEAGDGCGSEPELQTERSVFGIKTNKSESKYLGPSERSCRLGWNRKPSLLLPPPVPLIASAGIISLAALLGINCEQMCFCKGSERQEGVGGVGAFQPRTVGSKTFHCPKRTCVRTHKPK